ncbi:MAG: DUF2163 domain-containing protein [Armatimonadetes bacterium]|nr:DUF2163 domain-containing protein [Armatimonadota bacterium]
MPRTISSALLAHLHEPVLTVALCARLTRTDGLQLGFTSANLPIVFDGLTYQPSDGLSLSTLQHASGTGVDNFEATGILSDERISEADLMAGKYAGAELLLQLVNYEDLSMGAVILSRGFFGEIQVSDGNFHVEIRGLTYRLKQSSGEITSPLCRCRRLGDARCTVNLTPYTFTASVIGVNTDGSITFGPCSQATGYFDCGLVKFTSGQNSGLEGEIKSHTLSGGNAVIFLRLPMPLLVAPGDAVTLTAGCDRRLTTCQTKFSNGVNFIGEPYLPGNDQIWTTGRPPQ